MLCFISNRQATHNIEHQPTEQMENLKYGEEWGPNVEAHIASNRRHEVLHFQNRKQFNGTVAQEKYDFVSYVYALGIRTA